MVQNRAGGAIRASHGAHIPRGSLAQPLCLSTGKGGKIEDISLRTIVAEGSSQLQCAKLLGIFFSEGRKTLLSISQC